MTQNFNIFIFKFLKLFNFNSLPKQTLYITTIL